MNTSERSSHPDESSKKGGHTRNRTKSEHRARKQGRNKSPKVKKAQSTFCRQRRLEGRLSQHVDESQTPAYVTAQQEQSACHLGKMCQNPLCSRCFPNLGSGSPLTTAAWETIGSITVQAASGEKPTRDTSGMEEPSNLVELAVVLCTQDGTRQLVLKAIRVDPNDKLSRIRKTLEAGDIPNLPSHFNFLRMVGSHAVAVTSDQEEGSRAYRAKHFLPPHAVSPHLCICDSSAGKGVMPVVPSAVARAMRQTSDWMEEFCVKRMIPKALRDEDSATSTEVLGMIRLHRDATMSEIRQDVALQLPEAPREYQFVRMLQSEVTLVTSAQESASCKKPLRAYHFAPPYTERPEVILLTKLSYVEGEVIEDETKNRELKSLASALQRQGMDPRDMVKEKVAVYMNAFLNSSGGVLIFGASDDGAIERVPISGKGDDKCRILDDRVKLARAAKDDIRKLVDDTARKMDPVVHDDLVTTQFVPVRRRPANASGVDKETLAAEDEIYTVIEVHVKPGRRSVYFLNKHSFEAFERRDGSTHLMDAGDAMDVLTQGTKRGASKWRGGWRELQSPFDFDPLMRRLSDPWAGREWLFAAVRQSMFRILLRPPATESKECCGIGIVGSRGMGKTSFMSELALRPKHVTNIDVVAHHLCRADDPDTLSPALFVHSIAAMLARECKEYRSLMIESTSTPGGGDSIGAVMLRALRSEHCESDPDDAFLRGILQPLQEIETRRREKKSRNMKKDKPELPLVILVDALDESLAGATEHHPGRSRSGSVAHLLEHAMSQTVALPSWVKLIVSFRPEMTESPGPIQRLACRLDLINLDIVSKDEKGLQRGQEDIRMFATAYIERKKMSSPLGVFAGKGVWTLSMAAAYAKQLALSTGRQKWECETKPEKWMPFDDAVNSELLYAYDEGIPECIYTKGKSTFAVCMATGMQRNLVTGETSRIRLLAPQRADEVLGPTTKAGTNVDLKISTVTDEVRTYQGVKVNGCFLCGEDGHVRATCPNKGKLQSQSRARQASVVSQENKLLDALAIQSKGNYLYAKTVLEDVSSGRLQWQQVPELPCGLDHLYASFFHRHFNSQADVRTPSLRAVQPVLEVLLAAPKRGVTERDIEHAMIVSGACDPTSVAFCLRDIRWALDVDSTGQLPRYNLGHESIRMWLKEGGNMHAIQCREERGHNLLAASLLQRCWPQQIALSRWLEGVTDTSGPWLGWEPNTEDEDVFHLAVHLTLCDGGEEQKVALLQAVGTGILDSVYRGRTTALHSAALAGNVRAARLLLKAKASPDIPLRGRRPLHLAAGRGFSETVEELLCAGANVASRTTSGRTALLCAANKGSASTVKCILSAIADLEKNAGSDAKKIAEAKDLLNASQTDTGRTPLSIAAEEGHDQVIKLLLESGASVRLADRWGRTPIYYAARYGRVEPRSVAALVSAPGGEETLGWGDLGHMRGPLHEAVWHGHISMVRALLESNANPNLVENDCGSPLHEAAYFGSYGNSKPRKRSKATSPVDDTNAEYEEESVRLEILKLLLDSGRCMVDQAEIHGCTPLWYAAGGGWTSAVEALLDAGASVNPGELPHMAHKDRRGPASPLLLALNRGYYDTASLLLSRGALVPPTFDIDALASVQQVPQDLIDALRTKYAEHEELSTHDCPADGVVGYTMAKKCEPVPQDAFANTTA